MSTARKILAGRGCLARVAIEPSFELCNSAWDGAAGSEGALGLGRRRAGEGQDPGTRAGGGPRKVAFSAVWTDEA